MSVNSFSGMAAVPTSYGFTAGKNKIINGDCTINQRAFTSTTTSGTYGFDRQLFTTSILDGTATYSAQTFTPGTAPVAGYEAKNFARIVTTGQTNSGTLTRYRHSVEDVRTFANQTTTFSFWAKAATGTPKIAVELVQSFGSGGSPSGNANLYIAQVTLSTSWARYSVTVNVPSISGKTIGTTDNTSWAWCEMWLSAGSVYDARTGSLGIQNNTFDMWGFQWEAGSTATAFQTATGTIQGELAACQRYYYRNTATTNYCNFGYGSGDSATLVQGTIQLPVTMRTSPASVEYGNLAWIDGTNVLAITALTLLHKSPNTAYLQGTIASGGVQFRFYFFSANNNSAAYIGFSAEL